MTSIARLRELFSYRLDGSLIRLKKAGRFPAGAKVGSIDADGYLETSVDYARHKVHRIIWAIHYGEWPENHIDHINGNRTDNRIENLRAATNAENLWNRGKQRNNTSGYKGVSIDRRRGVWRATICVNGKQKEIGSFKTPEEAALAYMEYAVKLHGDFAHN